MPWLVLAMASGFAGDERFALSVEHGRIAFPYILFISLTALLSGVLNSLGRFALAAAAPILMNVVMIAFLLIGWRTGGNIGLWQIWSVPVAGLAQLALVWWGCARAGMPVLPRWPRLTPEMRRLAVIVVPALLTGGVVQINLLVGRQVGSFFDGAVAWLSYADRLYQLPLGVVGIAIGIVLLPDLSRRLKAGDGSGGRDAVNRAAELTLALTLPAAVALMVIPVPSSPSCSSAAPSAPPTPLRPRSPSRSTAPACPPSSCRRWSRRSTTPARTPAPRSASPSTPCSSTPPSRSASRRSSASSPPPSAPPSPAGS